MEQYKNFGVDDFVWDPFFRQWILTPTRESNTEWNNWLAANSDCEATVAQARQLVLALRVNETNLPEREVSDTIAAAMGRIAKPAQEEEYTLPSRFYQSWWFRIAASVILLIVIGWTIRIYRTPAPQLAVTEVVPDTVKPMEPVVAMLEKVNTGSAPITIRLSDKSKITLKKGSSLRYPSTFEASQREVYLTGEAFFDISKDPERPFIVYANELVTKVLGTSFLIKAYPTSREVTVEVKTGRVSVSTRTDRLNAATRRETEGVILSPNQKVIFERNEIRMVKTLVERPAIIVSKANIPQFQFEDTPVSEAFGAIAKAYGIAILFDEELLSGCPITATLDNQPLHDKLTIICKAIEATYEIVDGQIIINSKGCKTDI
jgi:transmembrane sensor